jgi:hypothetical protein
MRGFPRLDAHALYLRVASGSAADKIPLHVITGNSGMKRVIIKAVGETLHVITDEDCEVYLLSDDDNDVYELTPGVEHVVSPEQISQELQSARPMWED